MRLPFALAEERHNPWTQISKLAGNTACSTYRVQGVLFTFYHALAGRPWTNAPLKERSYFPTGAIAVSQSPRCFRPHESAHKDIPPRIHRSSRLIRKPSHPPT